jgi:hypothetical protein
MVAPGARMHIGVRFDLRVEIAGFSTLGLSTVVLRVTAEPPQDGVSVAVGSAQRDPDQV